MMCTRPTHLDLYSASSWKQVCVKTCPSILVLAHRNNSLREDMLFHQHIIRIRSKPTLSSYSLMLRA